MLNLKSLNEIFVCYISRICYKDNNDWLYLDSEPKESQTLAKLKKVEKKFRKRQWQPIAILYCCQENYIDLSI